MSTHSICLYPRHMKYALYMVYSFYLFCVCVCLSVSQHLFCVKDFSRTTIPRILKFCTHDKYD